MAEWVTRFPASLKCPLSRGLPPQVFDDAGERIVTKNAYKKFLAKKEKDAKKAAHKAAKGGPEGEGGGAEPETPVNTGPVTYVCAEPAETYGELTLVQSQQETGREFVHISQIAADGFGGKEVWVRARVHNTRSKGNNCFLVLRQSGFTLQVTHTSLHPFPPPFPRTLPPLAPPLPLPIFPSP